MGSTGAVMDGEIAWRAITAERLRVADLLEELSPQQWDSPSLCSEWRIRDVAAHLAMVSSPPTMGQLAAAAVRAGGSFHRMNQRMASIAAVGTPAQVAGSIRASATSRTVPAVTNVQNVLFDVQVHAHDIAIPLGIPHESEVGAARAGADRVWSMGWPFHARRRLRGLRLVATDADWIRGEGLEVMGPIQAHLLAVTGRPAALTYLTGEGTAKLAVRLRQDATARAVRRGRS